MSVIEISKNLGNNNFQLPRSTLGSPERATDKESLDNGIGVPELGRVAPELRQSPGHLARGDNGTRAELLSQVLQGLTKYRETDITKHQNCINVSALPLTIILGIN